MVRGAVPGSKGGWVFMSDAIKKALPEGAPLPGAFRKTAANDTATDKKAEAKPTEAEAKPAEAEAGKADADKGDA